MPDPTFRWAGQHYFPGTSSVSVSMSGLGSDYAGRFVLVGIRWTRQGTSAVNLTSATINGTSVSSLAGQTSDPGGVDFYIAQVPSGTAAPVTFGFSGAATGSLAWSVLTDLQSMAPVSIGTNVANNPLVNVSIPDKGVAVGYWASVHGVSPGTNSWSSPMTMDLNNTIATQYRHSVGHRIAPAPVASYNVQHFFNYQGSLVAATFR